MLKLLKNYPLNIKQFNILELFIGLLFCCLPLFITFPYKINLYLAWEGAYRIYLNQIPFRDFGMPLGYGFWLIPGLFFKIFGPFMSTLVKAQVFINALSLIAFSSILRSFKVSAPIRVLGLAFFCLSYVFINFWPWYNHTVFVYELIGLAFLISALLVNNRYTVLKFVLAAIFIFLSIFTKQDIGGLGLLIALALLFINNYVEREFRTTLIFVFSLVGAACLFILPLLAYNFDYWFNFGQPPHSSRIILFDYLDEVFNESSLILRLYIGAVILIIINNCIRIGFKKFVQDKGNLIFSFLVLGILVQALLAQVTTYIPENAHNYYHSFVFVFFLSQFTAFQFKRPLVFGSFLILIVFLWSHDYWRYGKRIMEKTFNVKQEVDYNYVSKKTWIIREEGASSDRSDWKRTPFRSLDNVYLPQETIDGMKRLIAKWSGKSDLQVLNMSELTQLAYELDYTPLAGEDQPLWYHRNVAFFDRESRKTCERIANEAYDLVLFETIPLLNRFYPPEVRACLQEHYQLDDKFLAPRIPENAYIEVYVRKQTKN